jgi:hypothetical protein
MEGASDSSLQHSLLGITDDEKHIDDGMSLMTAEDYLLFRLLRLLSDYQANSKHLSSISAWGSFGNYALNTITAILGLTHRTEWVPIVVAINASLSNMMEYGQVALRLRRTNEAIAELKRLMLWWHSLSMVQKRLEESKQILVQTGEQTFLAEAGVSQLTKLQKGTDVKKKDNDEKDDDKKNMG